MMSHVLALFSHDFQWFSTIFPWFPGWYPFGRCGRAELFSGLGELAKNAATLGTEKMGLTICYYDYASFKIVI